MFKVVPVTFYMSRPEFLVYYQYGLHIMDIKVCLNLIVVYFIILNNCLESQVPVPGLVFWDCRRDNFHQTV